MNPLVIAVVIGAFLLVCYVIYRLVWVKKDEGSGTITSPDE